MLNNLHSATLASAQASAQTETTDDMNKFYARTGGYRPEDIKRFFGEELQVVQFCSDYSVQVNKTQNKTEPCS